MGAVVVDSSIVIGLIRTTDVHHTRVRAAVHDLGVRGDTPILPATVLAESLVGSQRAGNAEEMRDDLVALFGPVRPVDQDIAWATSVIRSRHPSVRLPDALVIATGVVEDAVVLTADKRLKGIDPRVQVLSP